MKKYKLGKRESDGLHRVIALRDFGDVKSGDIGGYVGSCDNLSQHGYARVYGDAVTDAYLESMRVYGYARVCVETIVITGLRYTITISDNYMVIGCEGHDHASWRKFKTARIKKMDGLEGLKFWRQHRDYLLALCEMQAAKSRSV